MAKKQPKGPPATDIWADDQLAEVPAKNSGAVQLSERWVRSIRTYTKVSVWSAPVMALLLLVIYSNMGTAVPVKAHTITNQVDSPGKSAAIIAENQWIDSQPAPLNGGKIVAWDGFDVKKVPKTDEKLAKAIKVVDYTIEIHHFTLTDSQGLDYTSDLAIAISAVNGAMPVSTPSLTPIAPAAQGWASSGTWYGLQDSPPTEATIAAVNGWAKAFTSGDPTTLRLNVSDPAANHSYVPLTGVSGVEAGSITGGSVPILDQNDNVSKATPKILIVQVQLKLTWTAAAEVPAGGNTGNALITYDLLVEKADTAAPVIVAWGGAGSGPDLIRYGNAIIDRTITATGENK